MHLGSSMYLHVCFTWCWQWSRASSKLMQSKKSIPLMSRSLPVIRLQLLLPQSSLKCMVQTSCQLSCGDLHGRGRMGGLAAHHLSLTYISHKDKQADNSIPLTHSLLLHAMPIILRSLPHQSQNFRALHCTAGSDICNWNTGEAKLVWWLRLAFSRQAIAGQHVYVCWKGVYSMHHRFAICGWHICQTLTFLCIEIVSEHCCVCVKQTCTHTHRHMLSVLVDST